MRRYLERQRKKKKDKNTWLEVTVINGVPVLTCEGKIIQNTHAAELKHFIEGPYRARVSVDVDFMVPPKDRRFP